jgi:hypothetical protein
VSVTFGVDPNVLLTDAPSVLYGYKVTVSIWNTDSEQYDVLPDWSSKLLRTYAVSSLPPGMANSEIQGAYILSIDIDSRLTKYQVEIASFNMDGRQSLMSSATIEPLF